MTATYIEAARNLAGSLADELQHDVAEVERELMLRLGSNVETVEKICRHMALSGGKRLRPMFVSLAARAAGRDYIPQRVAAIGACMEMIHMATLIHDDVIDYADTRRGRPTAASVYGNTAGILSGDVMLALAMDLLAEDGDLRIIRTVSKAVVEMAEGEVLELQCRRKFDLTLDEHIQILRKKTAVFLGACCQVGAQISGADAAVETALAKYGEFLGIGFQIADDLLDFRGEASVTGKPQATDFREGCATWPLIMLTPTLSEAEESFLRAKFGNATAEADLKTIITWMEERKAFEKASDAARRYAEQAAETLEALPRNPARDLLALLPELLINREA